MSSLATQILKSSGLYSDEVLERIVSQRAASVRYADEILVLDDGLLVGRGTHDELLESCPTYQEIYYSQFPKEAAGNE